MVDMVNETRDPRERQAAGPLPEALRQGAEFGRTVSGGERLVAGPLSEREVIDALPGAVVVTDPCGRIVLWSATAERLYGWREPEVVGRSLSGLLAQPAEITATDEGPALVAGVGTTMGDWVVVRRDGSAIRVGTMTRPLVDGDGTVLAIVHWSDGATALHRAEQRSRDLSEQLHAAVEAGGLGTWRWNLSTGEMVWDERLEALFGLPLGGFDGSFEMFVSLLHPDDRDLVVGTIDDSVARKSPYRVEHRVVWPDGSLHWHARVGGVTLGERGEVTGTVGCVMDITDRMVQQEEQQRLAAEAAARDRLHRERLEFLGAINAALSASTTRQQVMRNVTRTAVPRLGDWCTIHVLPFTNGTVPEVEVAHVDPAMLRYAGELRSRFPYDPDARFGVARVIRTGEAEFHPDITTEELDDLDAKHDVREVIAALDLRSTMAVALRKRGRVLGALQFAMTSASRRYTADDLALAQSVADRIASSIENLRLYEQQRDIARSLQRSLLPATLPAIPGIDVAARYWPVGEANEVGGDFYDMFPLDPPGHWAIVIGDVCGTGPDAAALTGLARHSIRESAWHGDTPIEVLRSLNRAVKNSVTRSFLTAIYATLDTSGPRPTLTVTSGGHPFPICVDGGGTAMAVGSPGTLLGMLDDVQFTTDTRHLNVGDVVVFHTDGATDLRPPHNLDDAQYLELVRRAVHRGTTAEAIADQIHDALETVLTFQQRDDDIALLVLNVVGPAALSAAGAP